MMQNSYNITDQEVAYIANLHKNVKELHIYELISLRTTSYLLDTRSVVIATTQWKICSCGENMETTTHYLLQCSNYLNERMTLLTNLQNVEENILDRNYS